MADYNTLNTLIAAFNDIANRHKQLKSFGVGNDWEVGASAALTHAALWINPTNASMPKGENGYSSYSVDFDVKVFDLVNLDESNENEVLSDTFEIIKDVVNEFNTHPDYINSDFNIINDLNFTSFTEKFDSSVSGWQVTFTLLAPNQRSYCTDPIEPK